jgi:signal transduction histidine kinase
MLHFRVYCSRLCSHWAAVNKSSKSIALAVMLGVLLAGTVAGLGLELAQSGAGALPIVLLGVVGVAAAAAVGFLIWALRAAGELTRANAALVQRNRGVERASEAKTRFVANMSHELRTPLNAVIGFTELMHAGRTGPVSMRQREYLGIIRTSADHLLTLINEVLDISKIEKGHMRLDPESIDPVQITRECLHSMRWLAAGRRVRVDFEAGEVGPVSLDPSRLRQVVLNYLSNAIKFTGAGGRVTLTVARDGDLLLVAVEDTGIGISDEDQGRVFEEFVQVGSSPQSGSGLGLAVTRQIVEAQGGEVGVTSRLGFGSTFYALLPLAAAPAEGAPVRLDRIRAAARAGDLHPAGTAAGSPAWPDGAGDAPIPLRPAGSPRGPRAPASASR